jgi:hypothetical protein
MTRHRKRWLVAALLLLAGALLLPPVHWRLIGWARGEAFYQGRPTSYWEREIRQYVMIDSFVSGDLYFDYPEPTAVEEWLEKHLGVRPRVQGNPTLGFSKNGSAAAPVLMELLACKRLKVRLFAVQRLGCVGPEAAPACPALRELAQTTREYLVYREARIALGIIDPATRGEDLKRSDEDKLWARYRKSAPVEGDSDDE